MKTILFANKNEIFLIEDKTLKTVSDVTNYGNNNM